MEASHDEAQSLRLLKAFCDVQNDRERELLIQLVESAAHGTPTFSLAEVPPFERPPYPKS
jgi:hypothetical protein